MKKIISLLCTVSLIIISLIILTGCGNGLSIIDEIYYRTYSMKNLKPLDNEEIDELKVKVAEYFNEKYEIDVTEKMDVLKTYTFKPTSNSTANASHIVGDDKVLINREKYTFSFSQKYFASTWVHEAIHYLGFESKLYGYHELDETFTEIIALDLTEWLGAQDDDDVTYIPAARMCAPIIEANPEIVKQVISGNWEYIINTLNEELADTTFTSFEVTEEWTVAEQLNSYCGMMFKSKKEGTDPDPTVVAGIEEIVNAYCAKFND